MRTTILGKKTASFFVFFIILSLALGALSASAATGEVSGGMKFDGLLEYKTESVTMSLPSTFEAELSFPEGYNKDGGAVFGSYSADTAAGFKLEVTESGAPRLYIVDGAGLKYDFAFNTVNLYSGAILHLAVVIDRTAGSALCYVNGELKEAVTGALPDSFDITAKLAIGGDNLADNSNYFRGELFGAALYSDARTSDEVLLDSAGGEVDTAELIAAYELPSHAGDDVAAIGDAAYKLIYKCEWLTDVELPEDYTHSFAVIGDIQSMTYFYPDKLIGQFEWIRDNALSDKIAFSVGLGDLTEKNTAAEYQKVIEAYDKIDGVVPFSVIRGNHESVAMYDTYITQERYGDEITGSYDETMQNTYRIMRIGRVKYMFMNIDLKLSDGAIAWANDVIARNPDCHVIVSTHVYKNMGGSYLTPATKGQYGSENDCVVLWDNLLSQHENIVMVLYGHSPKNTLWHKQRTDTVNGNTVTEMLINPSETDKLYGGGGFVAMFYFSEDGEKLDVRYYSTGKGAYYRSDNQFTLQLDTPGTVVEFSSVIMNVGSDESERNLTWYTQYNTVGEVRYGKAVDGKLPEDYSTSKAVAVKAEKIGYYVYKATMSGLEENSTYVYQLVSGDTLSECYTFNTYSMSDDFSFAFITDPQVKKSSHAALWSDTLNKLKTAFNGISIVVSGGDQTSDPADENNFDWFISEHLSSLAIATTVGPPHDNTQLYRDHYNLPNLSSSYGVSTPSSDYFYTYNNVLFMHLNVENKDFEGHARFMENAINDNPDCLWRVVLLHYSFLSSGNHSTDGSVIAFREAMAGRFNELGVDVVLSGHDHIYSRSHMMTDGYTLSGDVVTGGSVTDPTGTLYICGGSSTGSGWYNKEHDSDDAYIAKLEDTNRKSVVIFTVSEGSLTLKSYFIDSSSPELFDSFTINKTKATVRQNGENGMLEILDGESRIPLVDAYAYGSATVKVVNGYWSLSTDGGESFTSLGIESTDTESVLRINPETYVWELSRDGGESFTSLGISARSYTVKYVALAGSAYGDATDLSQFSTRRFTAATPDAPAPYMPKGSVKAGNLYSWSWVYYELDGDGAPVDTFEYGKSYIAYPVSSELPISSTIYIDTAANPEEYIYTWREAWDIVGRCAGEKITLVLNSSLTLTADDAITVVVPIDLTLDLNGKRLDTSVLAPAVKLGVGSDGSRFTVITSLEGGLLNAGLNDFLELGSNQGSSISVQFGSDTSKPLTVESVKYLVGANGNFKYTSTLNLRVIGGSYTVARGVVYVSNVSSGASYNIYKIDLKDAEFNFFGGESAIIRARGNGYCANALSYLSAEGCVFKDTYKANSTSSRFVVREDNWYGALEFSDCDFIGMSLGHDVNGAALLNCSTITVGRGCTFKNSATSFNSKNPLTFFSDKVVLADGCVLARTGADGSAEVLLASGAAEITWSNPVGYKEYWKLGTVPTYLGDGSFTVGDTTYSLVLRDTPVKASADTLYTFKSAEGYLYKYNEALAEWQISTDGGNTYTSFDGTGTNPDPTPDPEPEPEVKPGCTVTVDGVSTTFTADTDFTSVIATVNSSSYAGKEITITLGADMTFETSLTFSKAATLKIDLAGNKLTYAADGRFKTGSGAVIQIYSSASGGEFVFGGTGDGFQPGRGTIIFGSEDYKNNLTVSATKEILNPGQTSDGTTLRFEFLYCTVNVGASNLIRINAKGAGAITLEMEIVGCTVYASKSIVCYNYTTTLGATTNGGVCSTGSYIKVSDSSFTSSADAPIGFFGSENFTDRYFGTVSFTGTAFSGYVINGELIYSDEALDYNTYYDTLAGYDPKAAITVGKDCVFKEYGETFTDGLSGFAAENVSVADGCVLLYTDTEVLTLDTAEHTISGWKSFGGEHWKTCESCNDGVKFNLSVCDMDNSVTPAVCKICGAAEGGSHEHDWSDATCTAPKTCKTCGETEGTELGHDWSDATCTAPKTCKTCGETEGAELGHDWSDATCTAPKTCKTCGETEGAELGHDWSDATCTAPKTCKTCGETEGAELGHDWIDATTEAPKTCDRCGETEGDVLPGSGSDAGEPPEGESHENCSGNWFETFWNAIVNFFRRMFGMSEICICGKERS